MPGEPGKPTFYQIISASLALNIFQHACILSIAFLFHFVIYVQQQPQQILQLSVKTAYRINVAGVLIINLSLCGSLGVIIQIIISSFNLVQLNHYEVIKSRRDNPNKKSDKDVY